MNIFKTKEEFDARIGVLTCLILFLVLASGMIYHVKRLEKILKNGNQNFCDAVLSVSSVLMPIK